MECAIRSMTIEDYEAVVELWRQTDGIVLSDTDAREPVSRFLSRNPDLSLVAHCCGELAGAVLSGHDGRRGYIHHLVTAKRFRRRGVGSALVREAVSRLGRQGLRKCNIFILPENREGVAFWKRNGFRMLPHFDWMQATVGADE